MSDEHPRRLPVTGKTENCHQVSIIRIGKSELVKRGSYRYLVSSLFYFFIFFTWYCTEPYTNKNRPGDGSANNKYS